MDEHCYLTSLSEEVVEKLLCEPGIHFCDLYSVSATCSKLWEICQNDSIWRYKFQIRWVLCTFDFTQEITRRTTWLYNFLVTHWLQYRYGSRDGSLRHMLLLAHHTSAHNRSHLQLLFRLPRFKNASSKCPLRFPSNTKCIIVYHLKYSKCQRTTKSNIVVGCTHGGC